MSIEIEIGILIDKGKIGSALIVIGARLDYLTKKLDALVNPYTLESLEEEIKDIGIHVDKFIEKVDNKLNDLLK